MNKFKAAFAMLAVIVILAAPAYAASTTNDRGAVAAKPGEFPYTERQS